MTSRELETEPNEHDQKTLEVCPKLPCRVTCTIILVQCVNTCLYEKRQNLKKATLHTFER
jgi:hypothetical protein